MNVKLITAPTLYPVKKKRNIINSQAIDLTGQQFGRWTVLQRAENTATGTARWLCRCSCGKERSVISQSLRLGRSTSCGCFHNEFMYRRSGENHPSYKEGRIKGSGGYVLILNRNHLRSRKGYVFEHILVMEKSIGRSLITGETVHHKNGIKHDNRIENLELWTGNHAPGVRVSDMVQYCVDYLRQYAPEKLAEGKIICIAS